jgi:hypothetical protein
MNGRGVEVRVDDPQRVPKTTIEIKVDGTMYPLTPQAGRKARGQARRRRDRDTGAPLPHNVARRVFVHALLRDLAQRASRELTDQRIGQPGDIDDVHAGLADEPAIRGAIDLLWPEFTPQELLTLLYAQPERLDLTDDERAAIRRDQPEPWTPADVPLRSRRPARWPSGPWRTVPGRMATWSWTKRRSCPRWLGGCCCGAAGAGR